MSTAAWITFGICSGCLWLGLLKELLVPLYKEWRWTRAHRVSDPPEPNAIEEYLARAEQSKLRTYSRQGIRDLPPQGHTSVGIDTRKDGLR